MLRDLAGAACTYRVPFRGREHIQIVFNALSETRANNTDLKVTKLSALFAYAFEMEQSGIVL